MYNRYKILKIVEKKKVKICQDMLMVTYYAPPKK